MINTFCEFFCGGGMARMGLGPEWSCVFANDIDAGKARSYAANFGRDGLKVGDVSMTLAELSEAISPIYARFVAGAV
jgi:DNA (cytosine-5)-methyltransferase 1